MFFGVPMIKVRHPFPIILPALELKKCLLTIRNKYYYTKKCSEGKICQIYGKINIMNPVVSNIINQLKPYNPEKIILFGSYASGSPTEESDVDLLVIKKTSSSFLERQKQVHLLLKTAAAIDVFVLTPEEFKKAKQNNLFIKEAAENGKIVYG